MIQHWGFLARVPVGLLLGFVVLTLVGSLVAAPVSHGNLARNRNDLHRAERRMNQPLQVGRPVEPTTRTNRKKLIDGFSTWPQDSFAELLERSHRQPEDMLDQLVSHGRELYVSGRP